MINEIYQNDDDDDNDKNLFCFLSSRTIMSYFSIIEVAHSSWCLTPYS